MCEWNANPTFLKILEKSHLVSRGSDACTIKGFLPILRNFFLLLVKTKNVNKKTLHTTYYMYKLQE